MLVDTHWHWRVVVILSLLVGSIGCTSRTETKHGDGKDAGTGHGHDHGHDHHHHDHSAGPHGGHLLDLQCDGDLLHAEWTHDDKSGLVAVYLLDAKTNQPVENPPASVDIEIRTGKEPKTFTLPSVTTVKDVPAQAAFALEDASLITALGIIVEGSEPTLRAQVGDKTYIATFAEHDHSHDHGHAHSH